MDDHHEHFLYLRSVQLADQRDILHWLNQPKFPGGYNFVLPKLYSLGLYSMHDLRILTLLPEQIYVILRHELMSSPHALKQLQCNQIIRAIKRLAISQECVRMG
jgi:hypothetical protein